MKVGIITFHFVPNQGAVLQCYAMQRYLESQGHTAYVIDYQPGYHTVRYAAVKNPFVYAGWIWKRHMKYPLSKRLKLVSRGFLRCIVENIKGKDKAVQKAFDAFYKNALHLTEKYTSLRQLVKNPPAMDAYISGSDQLWNPELLDQEFDGAYFLEFGSDNIPRIAYAVSMGKDQNQQYQQELKRHCEALTAISLREYSASSVEATGRDVHICLDPTLLLDAKDYDPIVKPHTETEPYIFVYGFESTADMLRAVKTAQEKYNCKIINGSPHRVKLDCDCTCVREYAPDMFLTYIKNAQCVVTNSFHATSFSIIYRKDFITVSHSTRGLRMTELLGKLGLECRFWKNDAFDFHKEIDWNEVSEKIVLHREYSETYLKMALCGKTGEEIARVIGLNSNGEKTSS